jgi:hypothetical protein
MYNQLMDSPEISAISKEYELKGLPFGIFYEKAFNQVIDSIGNADKERVLRMLISLLTIWLNAQANKPAKRWFGRFWRSILTLGGLFSTSK